MTYEYAHIFRDDFKLFWQDQQKYALNHSKHRLGMYSPTSIVY